MLQWIILLAAILMISIMGSQFMFLTRAYEFQEKISNANIKIALSRVHRELSKQYSNDEAASVKQLSAKCFVVDLDKSTNTDTLKNMLKREFARINITEDFQFSIYDTVQKKLILKDYVSLNAPDKKALAVNDLPKYRSGNYYFCIYFPYKTSTVIGSMWLWIVFSFLLLFSILFFSYSIYVILRQKKLSEMQKDFINNISHEFQTPIATISISSEALKNPAMIESKERVINYASIILNETQRLKKQVESILEAANIEKKGVLLQKEIINTHQYIEMAVEKLYLSERIKRGEVSYSFTEDSPIIYGDPLHLANIIYNLLDNAVKYSRDSIEIGITTHNTTKYFLISISDKGIGIEKKELRNIFGKFYRIVAKKSGGPKGFGIGLYYVFLIVKAHKGYIKVESEPGSGSTFSIYLPHDLH